MTISEIYDFLKQYIDKKVKLGRDELQQLFTDYKTKEVGENINSLNTVGSSIDNVNTVSTNIVGVNTTATNISNVNTVSKSINAVNTVSPNVANINTVAQSIDNVNITANSIDDVNTYAKTYYGSLNEDPTTRPDGTVIQVGDLYFNTTIHKMKAYDGNSGWVMASSAVNGIIKSGRFIGNGSTKSFAVEGGYDSNFGIVYLNGVEVTPDVDISDGQNIVFNTAPDNGDTIDYVMFGSFKVSNTVDLDSSQTIVGSKTFNKDITVSDDMQGLVLVDRSDTTKKYRLYVDNGNLGIEGV